MTPRNAMVEVVYTNKKDVGPAATGLSPEHETVKL